MKVKGRKSWEQRTGGLGGESKVKGLKLKTWSHVSLMAAGGETSALILSPSHTTASAQCC